MEPIKNIITKKLEKMTLVGPRWVDVNQPESSLSIGSNPVSTVEQRS